MNGAAGLVLTEVSAGYGETIVLESISLVLSPGKTLTVLGRNGVGKTTLLATIMGHTRLHRGGIRFAGEEIAALPPYRRARLGIGFAPQEREIFSSLTVEENLTIAERPGQWTLARVYDFFPSLAERRRNQGNQLSGGEQQMLAIGRALMGNPTLLLLDEPLEGLAPVIVDALLAGLERLKRENEMALLLVEQQQCRVAHQCAPDREHLLLAARQLIALIAAALGQGREEVIDACERPLARALGNRQILLDRQGRKDFALLRHKADAEPRAPVRGQARDLPAREANGAAMQPGMAHNSGEQSRLADPVAPQHRQCLTG